MLDPERPRARIKDRPEDFVVEEIPAYAPSGAGEHVFLRITKRDRTTLDAVAALSAACGCNPRETGFAGMKDKRAVATQTISLHAPSGVDAREIAERARSARIDGIAVLDATPHGNKLKPGHLAGNRFTIVVRDVARERLPDVERAFVGMAREGVPNAFGAQRFGRRRGAAPGDGGEGGNVERALAWLSGRERPPRDARVRRLLWSALQSSVFNSVLTERLADGTWNRPVEGDLLKLHATGGIFVCTAVQTDAERASRGELSPTGPIVGARMRWPEGAAGELERRVTATRLGEGFDLSRTRNVGEGSRRALRLWIDDLRWEVVDEDPRHGAVGVRVYFVLPKGGYATTVLGTALTVEETGEPGAASLTLPDGGPDDGADDVDSAANLHDSTRDPRSEAK